MSGLETNLTEYFGLHVNDVGLHVNEGNRLFLTSASNPAGRNEVCKSFLTFVFGDEPNRIT